LITGPLQTVKLARRLRSEMTLAELVLWRELRSRPAGLKFRRQHPAGAYVLDFYCASARLAVEVDGWAHSTLQIAARDAARSRYLRTQGIGTLRVPAKVILKEVELAVARIVQVCEARLPDHRRHRPCAN